MSKRYPLLPSQNSKNCMGWHSTDHQTSLHLWFSHSKAKIAISVCGKTAGKSFLTDNLFKSVCPTCLAWLEIPISSINNYIPEGGDSSKE